jgi:peptide deformylase
VGVLRRIVVVETEPGNPIELINPVIVDYAGEQEGAEGCLSLPGRSGIVKRPMKVKVRALNRKGEEFTVEGTELLARAFCHELDHLDGTLYTDRAEYMLDDEDFEEDTPRARLRKHARRK